MIDQNCCKWDVHSGFAAQQFGLAETTPSQIHIIENIIKDHFSLDKNL